MPSPDGKKRVSALKPQLYASAADVSSKAITTPANLRPFRLAKMPKTGEIIARELRKRIVKGELTEGAALPSEADLMVQLSVSRASLREALRILESEGLITVRRGSRGAPIVHLPEPKLPSHYFGLVLQCSGASPEDCHMARMLIEPPAVRLLVANSKRKVPPALLEALEVARSAVEANDPEAFGHALARFHDTIIESTQNKTLTLIMRMLNIIFDQHIQAIGEAGPSYDRIAASKQGLKAQVKLVELIAAGDADAAVTHWRAYLLVIKNFMFKKSQAINLIDVV
jgi:DNA-binding FadR family transcriptional regulator